MKRDKRRMRRGESGRQGRKDEDFKFEESEFGLNCYAYYCNLTLSCNSLTFPISIPPQYSLPLIIQPSVMQTTSTVGTIDNTDRFLRF